jgi:DNA-binding NarL/FixJ family response regulator
MKTFRFRLKDYRSDKKIKTPLTWDRNMKKYSTDLTMINVAIIEDDLEVRRAFCEFISGQKNFVCKLAEESVESFLYKLDSDSLPDIVLMDIGLPGMSGISGIKILKERYPEIEIVMLTVHNDPHKIFQSLCAGASGYLLKTTPFKEITKSLTDLYSGGAPMSPQIARKVIEYFNPNEKEQPKSILTNKEKEIVMDLVDGLSYKMIADRQSISIETVRSHIKNIYSKLHVHCKADVIRKSLQGEI